MASEALKTILVVEDDDDTREAICGVLEAEGYVVRAARDGEDAWTLLALFGAPDLILLDLMMPRMNGVEFLQLRSKREDIARVPVVVLTAGNAQPDGVLVVKKPLVLRKLLMIVARTIGHAASPRHRN